MIQDWTRHGLMDPTMDPKFRLALIFPKFQYKYNDERKNYLYRRIFGQQIGGLFSSSNDHECILMFGRKEISDEEVRL